jgi:hypothetical protein
MEHLIGQETKERAMLEVGLTLTVMTLMALCACADRTARHNAATVRAYRAPHAPAMSSRFRSGRSQGLANDAHTRAP